MTYRLTVLTVESNEKVISDFATLSAARTAANAEITKAHAKDTAVKIRDANKALVFYELCEGSDQSVNVPPASGKWYVRVMNITRGKWVGKRFNSESEARSHFESSVTAAAENSYDTAFILRDPTGTLRDYAVEYGNADQLETRPPNSAN